ncbi:AAA family ATPase, partial [Escherichia coli]|uniref:AAA family ATPase n=1 Tax=Escherichia coli TaxID=562 RepID=UPI0034D1C231
MSRLPDEIALLFIGDPAQLPPIGPGLLLHRAVAATGIPMVELDVVHRQDEKTGIPIVAHLIRQGTMPRLAPFDPRRPLAKGVFFRPAS